MLVGHGDFQLERYPLWISATVAPVAHGGTYEQMNCAIGTSRIVPILDKENHEQGNCSSTIKQKLYFGNLCGTID